MLILLRSYSSTLQRRFDQGTVIETRCDFCRSVDRSEQTVLLNPGLLLVVCSHRPQKTTVRNTPAVENITSAVDDDVHVLHAKPAAPQRTIDSAGDEIDVLETSPGLAQGCLSAGNHRNSIE